ncbi:MAG: hypothetical protein KAR45_00095 [Desulfobacteraceae bacterium]|nr:hypothetical protein [Desulfobacteraceae bacterium]
MIQIKTFDEYRVSPVKARDIMVREILNGMVRGLFSSSLILLASAAFGVSFLGQEVDAVSILVLLAIIIFAFFGRRYNHRKIL